MHSSKRTGENIIKADLSVVEARRWIHTDGRTASFHGAVPYFGVNDGWTVAIVGYTVYNAKSNTYGCGRPPFQTVSEAQAWIESLAA